MRIWLGRPSVLWARLHSRQGAPEAAFCMNSWLVGCLQHLWAAGLLPHVLMHAVSPAGPGHAVQPC